MQHAITDPRRAALVIIDLTNDFLHPDGAYARGGQGNADIAALPARVLPVAQALRAKGGSVVSAEFTLVPGRDGEPLILRGKVLVNPVSPDLLKKIQSWISRPSNTSAASPGSILFSTFTGLFMTRIGEAERVLEFTTLPVLPR